MITRFGQRGHGSWVTGECQKSVKRQERREESRRRWKIPGQKALELDDQLADAHIAMANVRFRFDWNWPEAERDFRRGLELSPNDHLGHDSYSIFLGIMGRFDEGMAEVTRTRELDPLSPHVSNSLSYIHSWSRRQDDAITESRRTLQLDPNFSAAHSALAWSYEEKGCTQRR